MQFGPAFLAESSQRIDGVAVHQLAQVRKGLVGREISVDYQMNDRLRLFSITAELDTTRIRLISA
jgi:hypothetical protein